MAVIARIWALEASDLDLYLYNPTTSPPTSPTSPHSVCDGTQNVKRYRYCFPVPNIFDTDTGTFSRDQIFQYRCRDFFPIPNFIDTGSETFSGTKLFRYRFQYHQKKWKIPSTCTCTSHSAAIQYNTIQCNPMQSITMESTRIQYIKMQCKWIAVQYFFGLWHCIYVSVMMIWWVLVQL